MSKKISTTPTELQNNLELACKNAVIETAKKAQEKLKECVDEQYYKDPEFYPNVYDRTFEFLNHVVYQLMTNNSAKIYIDIEGMHYKNGFSSWQVVNWASESKHGADYYKTSTNDFWSVFIEWCHANLINELILNLRKQGLSIR